MGKQNSLGRDELLVFNEQRTLIITLIIRASMGPAAVRALWSFWPRTSTAQLKGRQMPEKKREREREKTLVSAENVRCLLYTIYVEKKPLGNFIIWLVFLPEPWTHQRGPLTNSRGKVTPLMQLIFQLSWLRFYSNKVGKFITEVKCAKGWSGGKCRGADAAQGKSTTIAFFFLCLFSFCKLFFACPVPCPNEFSILSRMGQAIECSMCMGVCVVSVCVLLCDTHNSKQSFTIFPQLLLVFFLFLRRFEEAINAWSQNWFPFKCERWRHF